MSSDVNPNVTVKLTLDDTQFNQILDKVNNNLKKSAVHWDATLNLWTKAFGAIKQAVTVLGEWSVEAAKNAQEQQRLAFAIEQTGRAYAGFQTQLMDANAEKEKALGIDADNLVQVQRYLLTLGVLPEKLEFATRATIGLSDATGKDLQSAAVSVGKFLDGNLTVLTKLGFQVNSYDEGIAKLLETYSAKEATQNTEIVQLDKMKVQYGNLTEGIGQAASAIVGIGNKSSWLTGIMSYLNTEVEELNAVLSASSSWTGRWDYLTKGVAVEALPLPSNTGPQFDMRTGFGAGLGGVNAPMLAPGQKGFDPTVKKKKGAGSTSFDWGDGGSVAGIMEQLQQIGAMKDYINVEMARASLTKFKQINDELVEIELDTTQTRNRNLQKELEGRRTFFEKLFDLSVVRADREKQINQTVQSGYEQVAQSAINGISLMISGAIQAVMSGQGELGRVIAGMFGNLLNQVGQTMIQLGVIWGILAIITADPVLGARAAALGVAGAATIGLGAALGSGSGSGGGRASAGATSGDRSQGRIGRNSTTDSATAARRRGNTLGTGALPTGFSGAMAGSGNTYVNNYNVNFGSGVMVAGSKEEAGRGIRDLLKRAERLG